MDFKLYAPGRTTVECRLEKGKITRLRVVPEIRMKDVIVAVGFSESGGPGPDRQ